MVEILSDSLYSIEAIVAGEKSSRNNTFQIPGSRVTTARFDKKMVDCSQSNLLFISNETIRIRLIVNLQIATTHLEMMYRHLEQKLRQ